MTQSAADATSGLIGVVRLAALLARFRFRSGLNVLRARPSGPFTALLIFGLFSAVAYVGLFATTLSTIRAHAGADAETAALALMAGAVVLASLGAKASGEGLFAGTPENEFLLTRPVSLARLVVARCLAALAGDPFGTLFLLPMLIAAALAWNLSAAAWPVAIATSLFVQFTIAAMAQVIQVGVVAWVPRRSRTSVLVGLRLSAALTLAGAWVTATWVLRAPDELVRHMAAVRSVLTWSPIGLLVAPILALRDAGPMGAVWSMLPLAATAVGAGVLAGLVAARAGARGWEEAGAPFAESSTQASGGPPLTLVRREWRQLLRDRPRLAALVALPLLLFGVQLLGSVGWTLATATLPRVAMLTFSITVYLGALGPLPHMQHERRAFWILRSVPVSVGDIMLAKAKAWAVVLVGVAVVMFLPLALSVEGASTGAILVTGALVVMGALLTTGLAVALGCVVADLSDDQRAALGPGTVYLFLLVGGCLNVVFQMEGGAALRLLVVYVLAALAVWRTGMTQVGACLDPEVRATKGPRLSDAALLLVLFAAAPLALGRGFAQAEVPASGVANARVGVSLLLGLAALVLLITRRASPSTPRAGFTASIPEMGKTMAIGVALGGAVRLVVVGLIGDAVAPGRSSAWPLVTLVGAMALAEELILRGVLPGALEAELAPRFSTRAGRWLVLPLGLAVAWLASPQSPMQPWWSVLLVGTAPALARAAGGGVLGACAARLTVLARF